MSAIVSSRISLAANQRRASFCRPFPEEAVSGRESPLIQIGMLQRVPFRPRCGSIEGMTHNQPPGPCVSTPCTLLFFL